MPAVSGAAEGLAPSGTWRSRSNRSGMTVTAMSMITVPATTGVMMRRRSASFHESPNWKSEEAMTSVASRPGPPSTSAVTGRGDEGARRPHEQDVARPYAPEAPGLDGRRHPAHDQHREARPREVGLGAASRPHHDRHRDDDGRDREHDVLKGESDRDSVGWRLVRLIPDRLPGVACSCCHRSLPSLEKRRVRTHAVEAQAGIERPQGGARRLTCAAT